MDTLKKLIFPSGCAFNWQWRVGFAIVVGVILPSITLGVWAVYWQLRLSESITLSMRNDYMRARVQLNDTLLVERVKHQQKLNEIVERLKDDQGNHLNQNMRLSDSIDGFTVVTKDMAEKVGSVYKLITETE